MSHYRDRVITKPNLPQLPSGRRAIANLPGFTERVALAVAVNRTPLTISLTNNLTTVTNVFVEAKTATSP